MLLQDVVRYGKSMYGGWYVEVLLPDDSTGYKHFDTIYYLDKWLEEHNEIREKIQRFDN